MKNKIIISGLIISILISVSAIPVLSIPISKSKNIYYTKSGLEQKKKKFISLK